LRLERDHARSERREGRRTVTEVGAHVEDEVTVTHERAVQASQAALPAGPPVHDERPEKAEPLRRAHRPASS
jgi:hypothetical protein